MTAEKVLVYTLKPIMFRVIWITLKQKVWDSPSVGDYIVYQVFFYRNIDARSKQHVSSEVSKGKSNDGGHYEEEMLHVIATPTESLQPTHSLPMLTSIADFIASSYYTHTVRCPCACSNVSTIMVLYEMHAYLWRHLYDAEFARKRDNPINSWAAQIWRYARIICRLCAIKCRWQQASQADWAARDIAAVIMVVFLPPS